MSRTIRSLGLAVVATVALAAAGYAAPAQASKAPAPAKVSKPATHSVSGTLQKFDTAGKMLTVQTSKGTETLMLSSDAKILQGSNTLTPADLATHTGSKVQVRYTMANGQKTAEDVRLSGGTRAKAAASKKRGY